MPVYSAKSDTQYAAPGHRHLRSRSCRIEFASPGCLWRPGDFLLPGTMVPHAFYIKHDKDSSRRGGGGRQTFPVPLSRKFLCYLSFLSCSRDLGRAVEDAARGTGNRGVGYGILRMTLLRCPKFLRCLTADAGNFDRGHSLTSLHPPPAALGSLPTGAVRPRNDNSQEVWRGRTGSSAPTDAFRKCVGEGLCPSRGRGRTPPLRRTEKIVCDCFGIYINKKNERKKK